MYICVCKAVTDSQLRTAIDSGICTRRQLTHCFGTKSRVQCHQYIVCTRRQLTHCFGIGKDCGKCNKEVKELLEQCSEQTAIYPIMATSTY